MAPTASRSIKIVALATTLIVVLAAGGSDRPSALSRCDEPFVYDPHIDEIIPTWLLTGLESAIPPLQPGDKRTHHLRPWSAFCNGSLLTPQ
jgi:hypothetical protein